MTNGWFISDEYMNALQQKTFSNMIDILAHGGTIDVSARIDGGDYGWECDGLAHAKRITLPARKD